MKSNVVTLALIISALVTLIQARAAYVRAWPGSPPDALTNLTDLVAVSESLGHGFGLKADGTVIAWGDGAGVAENMPSGLNNVVAVATGWYHGLALRSDGTIVIWGRPDSDWLGNQPGILGKPMPTGLSQVTSISAGWFHSLALRNDGKVFAWGDNEWGQCSLPIDLTNVVAVSAGGHFSLALRADGTLLSWGDEGDIPAPPNDLTNVIAVSAGAWHCLGLRANGTVAAWGDNYSGEINVPPGLTNVVAVSAGSGTSVALKADGTVVAWGGLTNPPVDLAGVIAISADGLVLVSVTSKATINFAGPQQSVGVGSQAFFSVSASGLPPLNYQWSFGTNVISGATNQWLAFTNVQMTQSGNYLVSVSNASGSAISQDVILNVLPALGFDLVPAITVKGAIGSTYRIDYATAGPNNGWTPLATVTLTNSQQFYFDTSAIGQPSRFYRLTQVP